MGERSVFERIAGIKTYVLIAGKGQPVLLLHGLSSSTLSWQMNIESLSKYFTVYALDLPGHGLSEKPEDSEYYTIRGSVKYLAAFCRAFDLDQINIIGHSMGGLLAAAFALRYPRKTKNLVIMSSAGLGKEISFYLRLASLPLIGESIIKNPTYEKTLRAWKQNFYDPKRIPHNLVKNDFALRKIKGNREATLKILRYGVNFLGQRKKIILTEDLHALDAPTLIVWGREDRIIPPLHGIRAAKLIENSSLCIIEKCGHMPQIERKDELNKILIDFLI